MAEQISLCSDKEGLLAQAQSLRRRAAEVEAESDFAKNSASDLRRLKRRMS